jgi:CDP-diacylglycerol--glycerol-3-phosphate 3-phosphatidyltransferase
VKGQDNQEFQLLFDGRFRSGVDRVVRPVGSLMERTGVSPDLLTALGVVLAVPTALAIGSGRLGLGLALLIASAVPDLLDGAVAKAGGRATVRGAFFDSVCDRVTDTLVLGGMAWYLQDHHHGHAFMLPLAVLGASLLISYERAKAESLGFDAKGGLMERAERVVVLCVGLAFSFLLVPLLWAMLGLTLITAVQRFVKVWRQATPAARAAGSDTGARTESAASGGAGSGGAASGADAGREAGLTPVGLRWRAWREANGWTPRSSRFADGTRRSNATARWHERRRARLARLARERGEDRPAAPRRRSGSRRP